MFAKEMQLNNQSIWTTDFASGARRKAISKIPSMRVPKARTLPTGIPAAGVWMTDVSAMDSRSVKRSLQGGFSMRATWWSLASAVLMRLHRGSMEHAMYDFHRVHHSIAFFMFEFPRDYKAMVLRAAGHLPSAVVK